MLATLLLAFAASSAHPISNSSSSIVVDHASIRVEIRAQVKSLLEALPIDRDRDGKLSDEELAAARSSIGDYLGTHYRLMPDAKDGVANAAKLPLTLTDARIDKPKSGDTEPWVLLDFTTSAPQDLTELYVQVKLFYEQNPYHTDQCSIDWNGRERALWIFPEAGDLWHFVPESKRRPNVIQSYVELGIEHILTGYDHLAFLIALMLAASRLRAVVGVVTAFTVAHSITLALASMQIVHVDPAKVEMAIALSIAYVASLNLIAKRPVARWLEAFGFGLVHGLGFASAVADSLIVEKLKLTALVSFNVGVEIGQLSVVVLVALILTRIGGDRGAREGSVDFMAPGWLRRSASVAIAILGLALFVQRAGWVG